MTVGVRRARERMAALSHLNAFISATSEIGDGPSVAVKDVIDVAGCATTCGSPLTAPAASRDAAIVDRLRRSGCLVVGKTNLQPWAFGVTSANPYWGDVRNPVDPERIPGGSSGGSAAAVAAGMCDWAIGTDTGGSVRIPAALCGVVGVKPTTGTLDMTGVVPLAPTLDCLGILAPEVHTAESALTAVGVLTPEDDVRLLRVDQLHLAIPTNWLGELDADVSEVWQRISRGIDAIVFPDRVSIARAAMTILFSEAAKVHRRTLADRPELFPPALGAALEKGARITESEYQGALEARATAIVDVDRAMAGVDALIMPTVGRIAPRRGEAVRDADLTRYTLPFNVTGQPAISVPTRISTLPVGIQLVARRGRDRFLIAAALAAERAWGSA